MFGDNEPVYDPESYSGCRRTDKTLSSFTGNVVVAVEYDLPFDSQALGEVASPRLIKRSPVVLTMGHRCWQQGCGFY